MPFSTRQEASKAKKALFDHAEAIHNYSLRKNLLAEDPVRMSGSSRNFTWYLEKQKEYLLRFYNKTGRIRDGFCDFGGNPDLAAQLEATLFALGGHYLRIEGDFSKGWLNRNEFAKPLAVKDENLLFVTMFNTIRESLWADFEFRVRTFKPEDLPKAGSTDRILMEYYLDGGDVRQHAIVQNSHDADKYFHDVKERARDKYRVDYYIPWAIRRTMMCKDVCVFLNAEMPYIPPVDLSPHIFGPDTAPSIVEELQRRIDWQLKAAKKRYKASGRTQKRHSHAAAKRDDDSRESSDISDLMG